MFKLILKDPMGDKEFPITSDLTIGSDEDNQICLVDDSSVSEKHASISIMGNRVVLEDLDSAEGIRVNDRMVQRCALHDEDEVEIGNSILVFKEESEQTGMAEAPSMLGRNFGDYKIESSLGKAQLGEVFKAIQLSTKKTVALKIIDKQLTKDPEFIRSFLGKAPKAKKLNHPHLSKYLEFGFKEGTLYFSMAFVEGEPALQVVERDGPLEPERVMKIGVAICEALSHIVRGELAHLDVRPMNIILGYDGEVKLVGFGMMQEEKATAKAMPIVMGDPHYMAPEQNGRGQVDQRTDIYSLGATLYYLLTGKAPFEGKPLAVLGMHKMEARPNPCQHNPNIPKPLGKLIQRSMSIETLSRPANALEVAAELKTMLTGEAVTANELKLKQMVKSHQRQGSQAGQDPTTQPSLSEQIQSAWVPPTGDPITTETGTSNQSYVAALIAFITIGLIGGMYWYQQPAKPERKVAKPTAPPKKENGQPGAFNAGQPTGTNSTYSNGGGSNFGGGGWPSSGGGTPGTGSAPDLDTDKIAQDLQGELGSNPELDGKVLALIKFVKRSGPRQRKAVAWALGDMDEEGMTVLSKAIAVAPIEILSTLAAAAEQMHATKVVGALITRAKKEGAASKNTVFRAIGKLGGNQARTFVLPLLKSSDKKLRLQAWNCFTFCSTKEDLNLVFESLASDSRMIRNYSVTIINRLAKNIELQSTLRNRFGKALAVSAPKREWYAQAAAKLDPEPIDDLLMDLGNDENPGFRILAMKGLGKSEATARYIVTILQHEKDLKVIKGGLKALCHNPPFESIAKVLTLYGKNKETHATLVLLLRTAYGVDKGAHYLGWETWFESGKKSGDPYRRQVFETERRHRIEKRNRALLSQVNR